MIENGNEGLLIDVEPSAKAEEVCSRMVEVRPVGEGKLLLEANPAWAQAIEIVLIANGVTVNKLLRAGLNCAVTNAANWEEVSLRMES